MPRSSPRGPRILLVRLGAIGDVVHALPLLMRLRAGLPSARIEWAVGPLAAPLLQGHPALDAVHVLEKRRPLALLRAALSLRARRFDVAIDLQHLVVSALVCRLSGARAVLSFDTARVREKPAALLHTRRLPRARGDGPVVAQNLAFADALGCPAAPLAFGLRPSDLERDAARARVPAARFAALVVGAGKDANRPPARLLAGVAAGLAPLGLRAVVLGGARDAAEGEVVAGAAPGGLSLAGRTTLRESLAILERASVAVGGDTGPLHLAAALGTPVVALFGGANPARTGPCGSRARVVWRRWPCAPCYRKRCPIGRPCLEAIDPGEVLAEVRSLL